MRRDAYNLLLRERLSLFTRQTFRTVASEEPYLPNWHLEAYAHHLEEVARGRIRRLVITVAPRSLKSISASVAFPAWLLGRHPAKQIICLSYAQELAVKNANQFRTVMGAPWYKSAFPETVISRTKNTETEFETTRGGSRFSTSVGGVLTGRGGDIIIIDDPIKPREAMSETVRTGVNEWFDLTVNSRLNRQSEGAIILVMQRLHVDGRVEIIVVYKVDRLTRALSDFAKLVELFDRHGVSFVSVTQAFNTTSSMGRLTLNVLLSFAQFERELTGERIRDKIAASKRKGIWMGGVVPLGYRVEARALHIVPEHASLVRQIYERYLVLGSVGMLADALEREGIHAPDRRSSTGGRVRGGACSASWEPAGHRARSLRLYGARLPILT